MAYVNFTAEFVLALVSYTQSEYGKLSSKLARSIDYGSCNNVLYHKLLQLGPLIDFFKAYDPDITDIKLAQRMYERVTGLLGASFEEIASYSEAITSNQLSSDCGCAGSLMSPLIASLLSLTYYKTLRVSPDSGFTWAQTDTPATILNDLLHLVETPLLGIETDAALKAVRFTNKYIVFDTNANLNTANAVIPLGQRVHETDTGIYTMGDGVTTYQDLLKCVSDRNYRLIPISGVDSVWTDARQSVSFDITLIGLTLMEDPTGAQDGQSIVYRMYQDAAGGHVVNWGTKFDFGDIGIPVINPVATSLSYVAFRYVSARDRYDMVAFTRGYTTAPTLGISVSDSVQISENTVIT